MIGTYQKNILHRLGDALSALKGLPPPGALYQSTGGQTTGYISFPGWQQYERDNGNNRDEANVRTALQSAWVFADVQAIANEFSAAELIVKERTGAKLEDIDNHPLEMLWEAPNPHMGRSFLCSFWSQSYTFVGKAYLFWVTDSAGQLAEVWPIPPFMVKPIADVQSFIKGYAFKSRPDADPILIPPEYVTFSHSVNLFDVRDGMSFLAAALTAIKGDIAASQWNLNYFADNNAVPEGLISVSKETLDTDLSRVRQEIRDFYGGTKRGVAVARAGDLDYKAFGRSQKDMEFSQSREFASREIGRTMGFPDGYWSETANRANAEQARATMISGAVWPLLVRLAEDLNAQMIPRWYGKQYRAEFKDIRPEDRQLKLSELQAYSQFMPIKRLLEFIGQEPLGDIRDEMLIAEINKGAPTPGSSPAQELEAEQQAKDEAAAQAQAAAIEAGQAEEPPPEDAPIEGEMEEPAPAEEELPIKAQDASERAMFAKMGASGKLREKNSKGVRMGPREPRAHTAGSEGHAGHAVGGSAGSTSTAQQKTTTKTKSPLGDSLHVTDANDPAVKAHVRDLNKIPPELHQRVKDAGLNGVYVGKGSVPDLDDMEHLRNVQPRGYASGTSWEQSGGCYSPSKNVAVIGTVKSRSVSVALHEYGHAAGQNLGYDNDKRLIAIHKKLYRQGKLSPYYRQGGPGGEAGRQELFAEGFAAVVKNADFARGQYGDDFVNFIQKTVLKGGEAKP
jgi:HK97 family phage portal protein